MKLGRKERKKIFAIINKIYQEKAKKEVSEKKSEAMQDIMDLTEEGKSNAKHIYDYLLNGKLIGKGDYDFLVERISIVRDIAIVLSDCKIHTKETIYSAPLMKEYKQVDVLLTIERMEKYKCIETRGNGYCVVDAENKKQRLLQALEVRRTEEARRKTAYSEACSKIEEKIQSEAASSICAFAEECDARMQDIKSEMDEAIEKANKQRERVQGEISECRNKQSSLGFLKLKEKREIQAQIDELQQTLMRTSSQKQIESQYQQLMEKIEREKKQAIDKAMTEARAKYTMPKYEDFVEP